MPYALLYHTQSVQYLQLYDIITSLLYIAFLYLLTILSCMIYPQ